MRALISIFPFLLLFISLPAKADTVAVLVRSLKNSKNYKIRVTAATLLSKYRGDRRAKTALLYALFHDRHSTVRGTAALSLGKFGDDSVIPDLERVLKNKKENRYVKKMARKAIKILKAPCPPISLKNKKFYLKIGKFKTKGLASKFSTTAIKTVQRNLKNMIMSVSYITPFWEKCKTPSKRELKKKKIKGFIVVGRLIVSRGRGEIRCKLRILLATFPDKAIKMSTSGSAAVGGSLTYSNIQTCIEAVTPVIFQGIKKYLITQL